MSKIFNSEQQDLIDRGKTFSTPFRIDDGETFQLKQVDPGNTLEFDKSTSLKRKKPLTWAWSCLLSFRTFSMPRIAGPCC